MGRIIRPRRRERAQRERERERERRRRRRGGSRERRTPLELARSARPERAREERRSLAFYTRGRRRQGGRGRQDESREKERGGQDDDVHRREDCALFPERAEWTSKAYCPEEAPRRRSAWRLCSCKEGAGGKEDKDQAGE